MSLGDCVSLCLSVCMFCTWVCVSLVICVWLSLYAKVGKKDPKILAYPSPPQAIPAFERIGEI